MRNLAQKNQRKRTGTEPKLHEKYGWKEQFVEDVKSVRIEVRRRGGIKEESIEDAIQRYRYEAEEIAEEAERA